MHKMFGPAPEDASDNDVYIDLSTWNEERVEQLLLYSTLSSVRRGSCKERSRKLNRQFTKFTACDMLMGSNTEGVLTDVKPTDLDRPLDMAIVGTNSDYPNDATKFQIGHSFKLSREQARLAGMFSIYPVGLSVYFIDTEKEESRREPLAIAHFRPVKGAMLFDSQFDRAWPKNWQLARNWSSAIGQIYYQKNLKTEYDSSLNAILNLHVGLQFSARYDWYVLIGFEDLPKLQVFVDLDVIPELFDLRKVKSNDDRRSRLIHWVTNHLRRKPNQNPDEKKSVRVCEHLRGQYEFEWDGLNCWLIPSEFDRERLPEHTKHAGIW